MEKQDKIINENMLNNEEIEKAREDTKKRLKELKDSGVLD